MWTRSMNILMHHSLLTLNILIVLLLTTISILVSVFICKCAFLQHGYFLLSIQSASIYTFKYSIICSCVCWLFWFSCQYLPSCQMIGYKDSYDTPLCSEEITSLKPKWKRLCACIFCSVCLCCYVAGGPTQYIFHTPMAWYSLFVLKVPFKTTIQCSPFIPLAWGQEIYCLNCCCCADVDHEKMNVSCREEGSGATGAADAAADADREATSPASGCRKNHQPSDASWIWV